jgi:hypothetical protein
MIDPINIVIPTERDTAELQAVCEAIARHTTGYTLHLMLRPDLNVSECRQLAMDTLSGRYILFMDSDAHHIHSDWLPGMLDTIQRAPDAVACYAGERWGTEAAPIISSPDASAPWCRVPYGPAACMLIDRERLPLGVRWNTQLGLANGWLGGDFEEVEYAGQITALGGNLYRATNTLFDHRGGRTTQKAFNATDRCKVIGVIQNLLAYQSAKSIPSDIFWAKLHRIKASPYDDLTFDPSITSPLRTIFRDIVLSNNLSYAPVFRRLGIID